MDRLVTCEYCGTELPSGAMFCGECGRAVAPSSDGSQRAPTGAQVSVRAEELVEPSTGASPKVSSIGAAATGAVGKRAKAGEQTARESGELEQCAQCGNALETSDIFCGECGFVRQSVAARPRDTLSLDPFPWGLADANASPPAEPQSPPTAEPPMARPAELDPANNETPDLPQASSAHRFVLQFSTGESVSVVGSGLLGRNPVAEPGEYFDTFVTISDPGKTVSKTHLEFGQEGGAFWVSDRFSGNGTIVKEPEGTARRCDTGKRYRISRGTRVDIGEQFFIVS